MSTRFLVFISSLIFALAGLIFMIVSGGEWFDSIFDEESNDGLTWKQYIWLISWVIAIILFVIGIIMLVVNK